MQSENQSGQQYVKYIALGVGITVAAAGLAAFIAYRRRDKSAV